MAGNRLGGRQGTAYTGTNADQPPNWNFNDRDPNQYDTQNVALGDLWMNTATREVWVLVSLQGDVNSRGPLADWIMFSGGSGTVVSLTGNSGGVIDPDLNGNINVLGDTTTINVVGTPLNNTLTISAVGTGLMQSLTANSGGAVFPLAGNTNIVGDATTINIVGVPGTHTLTASTTGAVAVSFPTDSGTATPLLGVLQIKAGTATINSGSSVSFSGATNVVTLNVTDALGNTIIGNLAGNATLTSVNNTILGKSSGTAITSGTGLNVIVGEASGAGITTGSRNIILGATSGSALASTESNNIIIGNAAMVADGNTIRIGTQGGGAGQQNKAFMAGIYNVTPVVTNPYRVVIDSTGNLGTMLDSSFKAYVSAPILNVTGDGTAYNIIYDTERYDIDGGYNNATGVFTAPVDGVYHFSAQAYLDQISAAMTHLQFSINSSGVDGVAGPIFSPAAVRDNTNRVALEANGDILLTAGTTVQVNILISGGAKVVNIGAFSQFSGFLVIKS